MPDRPKPLAIAITGLALRLPGANSPETYWQGLQQGFNGVRQVDDHRRRLARSQRWSTHLGQLDDIDRFDYHFFGLSEAEARFMDPQQRLSLEIAYETLDDAGLLNNANQDERRIGVYVSNCVNSYNRLVADYLDQYGRDGIGSELMMGCIDSALSSKITHQYNFVGPAYHVNSACSSFMVQLDVALKDIIGHQLEGALVIGANILTTDFMAHLTETAGIISPGEVCRVFDAQADGTLVGEGVIGVFLEPLDQAVSNHRQIYGVIRGIGINNDGFALSLTSPNPKRQYEAMKAAYHQGGIDPNDISYIEAHGTGTLIGDPIELNALTKLFGSDRKDKIALGAAKTNVGHLLGVAGGVGLAKVLLSMRHQSLAPTINLETINPQLELAKSPFEITTVTKQWDSPAPRIAGINCFGVGGTNTHLIVEEYQDQRPVEANQKNLPLVITAKTADELHQRLIDITAYWNQSGIKRHYVQATLNRCRNHYRYRAYADPQGDALNWQLQSKPLTRLGLRLLVEVAEMPNNFALNNLTELKRALGKRCYITGEPDIIRQLPSSLRSENAGRHDAQLIIHQDKWLLVHQDQTIQLEPTDMPHLIGQLFLAGAEFDWSVFHPDGTFVIHPIPSYPFAATRVWLES